MKRMTFFSTSARRWLAAAVLLFVGLLPMVGSSDFYYKATVSVADGQSGWGKVYISARSTSNPTYSDAPAPIEDYTTALGSNTRSTTQTFYFGAQVTSEDYIFDHWNFRQNNGDWNESFSNNPNTSAQITLTHKQENNPDVLEFQAVFKKQDGVVKVAVAEGEMDRGSVTINKSTNEVGDDIVLTAIPDVLNGVHFLGWTRNDEQEYITDNPYSFTIDANNQGTYYAHFSVASEQVYCRIRNKGTGRYLTLYGNKSAQIHYRNISGQARQDGYYFNNSLKLIGEDEAIGNPMTVFLRSGHPSGTGITTGVNLQVNTDGTTSGVVSYNSLVGTSSYPLYMVYDSDNDGVLIYTTFTHSYSGDTVELFSYLTDEGEGNNDNFAMMYSENPQNIYWDVIILDDTATDGSFGANAKSGFSGNGTYGEENKYYTTMYTNFPYKLLDGVKAYYLPLSKQSYTEDTKTVHFTEISNIVPSFSAVVLECPAVYSKTNNRLRPLTTKDFEDLELQEPSPLLYPGSNLLNGYLSLSKNAAPPQKEVNNEMRYILSKVDGKLGWYYFTADYMTPYKAFLDLSEWEQEFHDNQNAVREIKFMFGFDDDNSGEATGVIAPKFAEEFDGPLFDLNGRRVTDGDAYGLKKGIYISNGKKVVIK